MSIGKNLREIRCAKGFTMKELSNKSKVSQSYISDLENEKNNKPSIDILNKLSKALEVPLTDLLGIEKLGTSDTYINDNGKVSHVFSDSAFCETGFGTENISDIKLISAYIGRKANIENLKHIDNWQQIIDDVDKIIKANLERERLLLGTKID